MNKNVQVNKEYICTIDGVKFLEKDHALKYLESKYLTVVEKSDEVKEYQERLSQVFPDFIINIIKKHITKNDRESGNEFDESDKEIFYITMQSLKIEAKFGFRVIERKQEISYYDTWKDYGGIFNSLNKAIDYYKLIIDKVNTFEQKVYNELSKYIENINKVFVYKINESGRTSEDHNEYYFRLLLNDNSNVDYGRFEFELEDFESEINLDKETDSYISKFKGRYITAIEGEVETGVSRDSNTWFEVNGISINHLASRAKRMRVEILELK
jgi:hypothetical protein